MFGVMRRGLFALGLWALCSVTLVWAQSDRGTITGSVTDPSGVAIAGVSVLATNDATGITTKVLTGPSGSYTIPLL